MSIQVQNISKSYKTTWPLRLFLLMSEGGLIGPDGAGTTIFRIITTLLPNEGTATIAGFDVVRDYKSAVVLAICQESFHCIRI
jgi:ABC-type multidrug transport system ATPase subunit